MTSVDAQLNALSPAITTALASRGVTSVKYMLGHDLSFSIWLVVESDDERDALLGDEHLKERLAKIVSDVLPETSLTLHAVTGQSMESVNRDYHGSWFYAMR